MENFQYILCKNFKNLTKNVREILTYQPVFEWRQHDYRVYSSKDFNHYIIMMTLSKIHYFSIKGTVMQIEKALTNDLLRVSKVSWKFRIATIYNFVVICPWNSLFSWKVAYFLTVSIVFSVHK